MNNQQKAEQEREFFNTEIYKEIKDIKRQNRQALYYGGIVLGATLMIAGASIWAGTLSACWQRVNALGIAAMGLLFGIYCISLAKRLRKQ